MTRREPATRGPRASCRRTAPALSASRSAGSPRPPAARRSGLYAPRLRVDVDASVTDEAAQRQPPVLRQLDCKRRRSADGDQDGTAGDRCLLDELEREPAADAENVAGKGQERAAERPADHLVHRVVSPDVLARAQKLAIRSEKARRMQATGGGERGLRLTQANGQLGHDRRRESCAALD